MLSIDNYTEEYLKTKNTNELIQIISELKKLISELSYDAMEQSELNDLSTDN